MTTNDVPRAVPVPAVCVDPSVKSKLETLTDVGVKTRGRTRPRVDGWQWLRIEIRLRRATSSRAAA